MTEANRNALEQLLERDWAGLEVLEKDGRLLFPDKIYRRQGDGTFRGHDVLLQVPREPDLRWARIQARRIANESDPPLDPDRDRDLIDNLEALCLVSRCMRDPQVPTREFDPDPAHLEAAWDKAALTQIYEKLDRLAQVVDPRPTDLGEEEMLALVAAVAKARNILPLAVYGPAAQNSCIVTMADRLVISLASR
jgi:hypothetical protein